MIGPGEPSGAAALLRADLDALIDLVDGLLDQIDRGDPMAALVGDGQLKRVLRLLQIAPGVDHVLLDGVSRG